jgi:predicted acyl esterase
MGRAGWFDEVMRWFDQYLQDGPVDTDPALAVESSDGTWRAESAWPPADSSAVATTLNGGSYTDDGQNDGTGSGSGTGIWTVSKPLAGDAHFAGVPRLTVDVASAPANANLVGDVYDIDAAGNATLISRGAYLLSGPGSVTFDLYGDDWKLPAGHRVGVLLTSSNAEWWLHVPTLATVQVRGASVSLPYLRCTRTATIQGDPSVKLESYRAEAPFAVGAATLAAAERPDFDVPATGAC